MKRKKLLITVSVLALAAAGTGIYVAPLAAEPDGREGLRQRAAGAARARRASGAAAVPEPQLGAARRHGQRCQLPQPDAGRRAWSRCAARRMSPRRSLMRGRTACRLAGRGASIRWAARPSSAAASMLDMRGDERDPARCGAAHGDGRRRGDLARHPERDPSAFRGQGDAIDRHLHRRRLDLGQRARHGPSRRRADGLDPVASGSCSPTGGW